MWGGMESCRRTKVMPASSAFRRSVVRLAARWVVPVAVALLMVPLLAGVYRRQTEPQLKSTSAPWPAPDKPSARISQARLPGYAGETAPVHFHVHLAVFVDGEPMPIPAGIGVSKQVGAVHTHKGDGIIHVEVSVDPPTITLGQFFTVWGVRLDSDCVGSYCEPGTAVAIHVDGREFGGDPRVLELQPFMQISVVIGRQPATIPSRYECHNSSIEC